MIIKKEFLLTGKEAHVYLQNKSLSCTLYKYQDKNSYMYKFENFSYILEEYKSFKKLVFLSSKEVSLNPAISKLREITDDKKYSKNFLKLFGEPKSYEFDEKDIFDRCDTIGLSRLDLHFKDGMSSAQVFRVILYRLNQVFILEYDRYMKKEIEYKLLERVHMKLLKALKYSKIFFDRKIRKQIKDDIDDLYMLLNHKKTFQRYVLNFQVFIYEKSFYNSLKANKPIYFFEKKEKLFELLKR